MIRFISRVILACRILACELHLAGTYKIEVNNGWEYARLLAVREAASQKLARLRARHHALTCKPGQRRTFDLA
jgi:hypothetical protein